MFRALLDGQKLSSRAQEYAKVLRQALHDMVTQHLIGVEAAMSDIARSTELRDKLKLPTLLVQHAELKMLHAGFDALEVGVESVIKKF